MFKKSREHHNKRLELKWEAWNQNGMVCSTCAAFVAALVKGLESDSHCVFNLCSICDRPGGQLAVRFPWCFHGISMVLACVAALVNQTCMVFPCLVH